MHPPSGGCDAEAATRSDRTEWSVVLEGDEKATEVVSRHNSYQRHTGKGWNPAGPVMRHEGHGGRAGKANDLHTKPAETNPRCHLKGSGDDVDDLEGHLTPGKAA